MLSDLAQLVQDEADDAEASGCTDYNDGYVRGLLRAVEILREHES